MTGRAASAVCIQTMVWIQTIDHHLISLKHTPRVQTQLMTHPNTQTPSQTKTHKKEDDCILEARLSQESLAGLQCHSLRSGKHSTGRTLLSEIKVCSFCSGNWMKTEVQNVLCLSGVVFCTGQTPRSEQISHLWETQELLWTLQPYFMKSDQIFRSRHECLLWDHMGDHQGQLLLPSQEEGWVASRWL